MFGKITRVLPVILIVVAFLFAACASVHVDGQKVQYEGEKSNGLPDGKGVAVWPNGDRYDGLWQNGLRHGHGAQSFSNGNVFEGQWVTGKPQGQGRLNFNDGSTYVGQFKDGLMHGQGELVWASHSEKKRFKGQFDQAHIHGVGVLDYVDGTTYSGDFVADLRSGQGILKDGTGRKIYSGKWIDDAPESEIVFRQKLSQYSKDMGRFLARCEGKTGNQRCFEYYWETRGKTDWIRNLDMQMAVQYFKMGCLVRSFDEISERTCPDKNRKAACISSLRVADNNTLLTGAINYSYGAVVPGAKKDCLTAGGKWLAAY